MSKPPHSQSYIAHRRAFSSALALLCSGCGAFSNAGVAQTYFLLEDRARSPATGVAGAVAAELPIVLLIIASASDSLADSRSVVFSRAPGQRAAYQFAAWTERPSQRIIELLITRLTDRHAFSAVTRLGDGVRGDVVLSVELDELFHDLTGAQAMARIGLSAALVDRRSRQLLGRMSFASATPVATENAAGAVASLGGSLGQVFDAMVPWLVDTVRASVSRAA